MELQDPYAPHWFVLHFIHKPGKPSPQKYIDNFNKEGHSLQLFAPIIRPANVVDGKVVFREKLLTYYYVFVNGSFSEVKDLCSQPNNDLSFLLDRGSERRYAIISDRDMESFRIFARAHTNMVPFFNIEDIELSEGDIVEVVGGQYAGLKGTYMPRPRSNKGNLVIAVTAAMGAVAWDIDAKCVRILEFAHDTRRQYDIVDSFIPRLLPILRKFHDNKDLDQKEKSQLNIFNQRMGVVSIPNHKAEAKLLATLMCVQYLLGDLEALRITQRRFDKRKSAITNPWTLALTELLLAVATNDTPRLAAASQSLPSPSDRLTATQRQLLDEFSHYLGAISPPI